MMMMMMMIPLTMMTVMTVTVIMMVIIIIFSSSGHPGGYDCRPVTPFPFPPGQFSVCKFTDISEYHAEKFGLNCMSVCVRWLSPAVAGACKQLARDDGQPEAVGLLPPQREREGEGAREGENAGPRTRPGERERARA